MIFRNFISILIIFILAGCNHFDHGKKIVINRFEEFGTSGYADKIKPINLEKMIVRYKKGELEQKVL